MAFLTACNARLRGRLSSRQSVCACAAAGGREAVQEGSSGSTSSPSFSSGGTTVKNAAARRALWKEVGVLRVSLTAAVREERYVEAARLRDLIEDLSLKDEYVRTQRALDAAVAAERYGDAAKLRDMLTELSPPPDGKHEEKVMKTEEKDMGKREMFSECTTDGITVRVESYYMKEQSKPEVGRLLFGYRVRIRNDSAHTVQLVGRVWRIRPEGESESNVRGAGVVGRQPVLTPGDEFEYTSACPISRSKKTSGRYAGSMEGVYDMCRGDTGAIRFQVRIARFHFWLPEDVARASGL